MYELPIVEKIVARVPSSRRADPVLEHRQYKEIDFVLARGEKLAALEVKSADAEHVSGMKDFKTRYARAKTFLIGGPGMSPEQFFGHHAQEFIR